MHIWLRGELKRINILEGSVSSGKTWISLVMWAFWVGTMPKDKLYLMCAKSLTTLKRNCLLLLQDLVGEKNFTFSLSTKEGKLFGRTILLEGANDARSESKIRGMTLQGAYCDELTQFPEDFFAMLLSRLRVEGAKLISTTNPDVPTHWLKTKYIDRADELDLLDVKFLIDDNTTLEPSYIENIKREYVGVFRDRFIKGLWVAAQGAIYTIFSDNVSLYYTDNPDYDFIQVGVDFGGHKSAHTFVATGLKYDNSKITALMSERYDAVGKSPDDLYNKLNAFLGRLAAAYGTARFIYADSAEQTLINGMRTHIDIAIKNSIKNPIIDRIRATTGLMASGRFFITRNCGTLVKALSDAVYNEKKLDDERLDDGTSDIDTLDAFEYSWEKYIKQLVRVR